MTRALLTAGLLGACLGAASTALARDAGVSRDGAASGGACVEHLPAGKARPKLVERFPDRALSGHAANLELSIEHGKGETVMPNGFRLDLGEEARELSRAGFALPHPDGGAGPTKSVKVEGERATTTLTLPILVLPEKPGRQTLVVPPLPVSLSRASGELITLCTAPHEVLVEDPIANTPDPKPRDNPPPRRQLEEWETLKQIVIATLIALLVGALAAWLLGRYMRREKPGPAPPPPKPPWETALQELRDLRAAGLVERERYVEHYDRVSHIVRRYCGDRYDFDGLESTTREMLSILRRVVPPIPVLDDIEASLRHADLVKFARLTPTAEECQTALERGQRIVERTIPIPVAVAPRASQDGVRRGRP